MDIADAATDRCEGYLASDNLTPIIGNYCKAMVRTYAPKVSRLDVRKKRADIMRDAPYWLITGEAWPQDPKDIPLMISCVAARVGISEDALKQYCVLLDGYSGIGEVPCLDTGEFKPLEDSTASDGLPSVEPVDERKLLENVESNSKRVPPECKGESGIDRGSVRDGSNRRQTDSSPTPRPTGFAGVGRKGRNAYRECNNCDRRQTHLEGYTHGARETPRSRSYDGYDPERRHRIRPIRQKYQQGRY